LSGVIAGHVCRSLALDASHVDLAGRSGDTLLDSFIFAGDSSMVSDVWAAGRHVVRDGRHVAREAITSAYAQDHRAADGHHLMTAADTNSWQGVRAEVMRRIADGDWKPGELIPGEVDLADEFGCARATVNRALAGPCRCGPDGTQTQGRHAGGAQPGAQGDGRSAGGAPGRGRARLALLVRAAGQAEMTPSPAITPQYGLKREDASSAWLVDPASRADHEPFALEERWVNLDVVPAIAKPDLLPSAPTSGWCGTCRFAGGVLVFRSQCASSSEAQLLGCGPDAALFIVNRTTWAGDAPITAVRLAYAPGYVMETVV
jgi:GntR family histidine utilization transcriptional repressor